MLSYSNPPKNPRLFLYFLLVAALLFIFFRPQLAPPTSYAECIALRSSVIQESYPSTCVAPGGQRFIQPLTDEERQRLTPPAPDSLPPSEYTCPTGLYVNCMPIVDESRAWQCEEAYIDWATANCPDFEGVAY